jgi:hypothetical protein
MSIFKGIAFPLQVSPKAFPAPAEDDALIKQSLVQIIMTLKGERVMRPEFGSGALSYIFENSNEELSSLIRFDIASALSKYEPRVLVRSIDVARQESLVSVQVNYLVVATNKIQTLTVVLGSE